MKKLLGILLSLCMVMCFMPSFAFADNAQITLEKGSDKSGASLGNIVRVEAGASTQVYLFHVTWYEDGGRSLKLIIPNKGDVKVTDSSGNNVKDASVAIDSDGKVNLNIKDSCIPGRYYIAYKDEAINLDVTGLPVVTATTLEMGLEETGASLGNLFNAEAGASKSIYLFYVDWYENGGRNPKLIKSNKEDIIITDSSGNKVTDISVATDSDGKVNLDIKDSCIPGRYFISYHNGTIKVDVSNSIIDKKVAGLKAVSSNDGIKLSWDKNLGNIISGVEIYRSVNKNKGFKLLDFTTASNEYDYTDDWQIEAGKTYYYKIRGIQPTGDPFNKNQYSKFSNVVKASAPVGEVKTITGIKAESVDDGIKIRWDNDFGDSINGFEIYRSTYKNKGFKKICFEYDTEANTYTDKWGLKVGKKYYYKVRGVEYLGHSNRYSKYSKVVSASSTVKAVDTIVNHTNSLSLQEIYMLPNVKKLIINPKNEEDYLNNILYSFMNGNYALNYKFNSKAAAEEFKEKIKDRLDLITSVYPDLCGVFTNAIFRTTSVGTIKKSASKYVFTLKLKGMPLSNKEIYSNQKAAIETAKQIYIDLHKTGKITEDMNEKEKAVAISQYLLSRNFFTANGGEANCPQMGNSFYDTAYANLVAKKGCCASWAAAFNMIAHMEGIFSTGVTCEGHLFNRIVADGIEYFHDTGNSVFLKSYGFIEANTAIEGINHQELLKYVRDHSVKYEVATKNAA